MSSISLWPAVAAFSGIAVTGAGEQVPEVPLLVLEPEIVQRNEEPAGDATES